MNTELMFSSKTDDWATPQWFFDELNKEFHFTLDPCADDQNHKCDKYYTVDQDGLKQNWSGETVFCNPPYSKPEKPCKPNCKKKKCQQRGHHITEHKPGQVDWIRKCYIESLKQNTKVVMLIPVRTDTEAFHKYIKDNSEIRFVKGRLKFGGCDDAAPFPNMVVIFH
ncbi:DNA N-6-adenine-methyltransferase [Anaerocolumna chitinilytica]|uniref:DNA N-6-adenine-methyltransferase of bacteriophage n=1 Tax=Anaerocolumna chitinilytica TaxID=1727145 RepID=A0A7M3SAK7_9FIRM|nr:DNA N-6-adenine-methyltransferase [Anaerocolumna chitinilytica]BCK01625.1 DNA N-6-adenine-methyltransferase of bacteriophage [Anaerocolumna chitinilytica]